MGGLKQSSPIEPGHSVAYRVHAMHHKALGFGIYCVIHSEKQWPLAAAGGFTAIAVKGEETYQRGFKDIRTMNWHDEWPVNSKIVCKAYADARGSCIDDGVHRGFR